MKETRGGREDSRLLIGTKPARKTGGRTLKVPKGKNCPPRIPRLAKVSFKKQGKINTLSDIKLYYIKITSIPSL